jgi:hypothetical protein
MKKYQINYIINGKLMTEFVEAVSRKAARKYFETLGLKHTKLKDENQ